MAGQTITVFSSGDGCLVQVTLAGNSSNSAAQSVTVSNSSPYVYHLTGTWQGQPITSVAPSAGTNPATGQPWPAGDIPPNFPQTTIPLPNGSKATDLSEIGAWTNFTTNP